MTLSTLYEDLYFLKINILAGKNMASNFSAYLGIQEYEF